MWLNKNIKIKYKQAKVEWVNDKYAQMENSKRQTQLVDTKGKAYIRK